MKYLALCGRIYTKDGAKVSLNDLSLLINRYGSSYKIANLKEESK